MNIKYLQVAKDEFHDAIRYYEIQQTNLGKQFQDDVKKSISRIKRFPKAYEVVRDEIRRCLLHKFSYSILYTIDEHNIVIIAISHQHRKPDYWLGRL